LGLTLQGRNNDSCHICWNKIITQIDLTLRGRRSVDMSWWLFIFYYFTPLDARSSN